MGNGEAKQVAEVRKDVIKTKKETMDLEEETVKIEQQRTKISMKGPVYHEDGTESGQWEVDAKVKGKNMEEFANNFAEQKAINNS